MPAKSESQRRLFGMVLAAKRGELKDPSPKIKKISQGISENDARDFAHKKKRANIAKSMMSGPSGY